MAQKRYYYKEGDKIKVYDRQTDKHITGEQAANIPDFWSQVEAYNYPAPQATASTPTPTPTPTPSAPAQDKSHQEVWKDGKSTIVLGHEVASYLSRGYTSS